MRREMQEIVAGVFLGPYAAASKRAYDKLKGAGITHIVCIRHRYVNFQFLTLNVFFSVKTFSSPAVFRIQPVNSPKKWGSIALLMCIMHTYKYTHTLLVVVCRST